ncbi:MAG: c-type cytochrome [Actinomycetota bacterium]
MTGMLALTRIQGLILAAGGVVFIAIAGATIALRGRTKAESPDIPPAMRPGPSDPDLETPLLNKLQGWGVLLVVFFVIWIPLTWLREPSENLAQERALKTDAIERGKDAVQLSSEENQTGIGCVRCHGPELRGSQILDTKTGVVVPTPDLTTVCGGPFAGHPAIYSLNDVYTTIRQGRGLMPSWSIRYAGALDDQQISDIVNYLLSIQDVPFKDNVCLNPEATKRAIEQVPLDEKPPATTNITP